MEFCAVLVSLDFVLTHHNARLPLIYFTLDSLCHPTTTALDANGDLLPAEKITWYNDPDDTTPISAPSADLDVPMADATSTTRRTTRPHKPAHKLTDPNNVEFVGAIKRPASPKPAGRRVARKVVMSDDEGDANGTTGAEKDSDRILAEDGDVPLLEPQTDVEEDDEDEGSGSASMVSD